MWVCMWDVWFFHNIALYMKKLSIFLLLYCLHIFFMLIVFITFFNVFFTITLHIKIMSRFKLHFYLYCIVFECINLTKNDKFLHYIFNSWQIMCFERNFACKGNVKIKGFWDTINVMEPKKTDFSLFWKFRARGYHISVNFSLVLKTRIVVIF